MVKMKQPPSIPLAEAAKAVGRKPARLRQICNAESIGTMVNPRMRLLTPEDVEALKKAVAEMKIGRPKKN